MSGRWSRRRGGCQVELIGTKLNRDEVVELVQSLHYRPDDFDDGDIEERLRKYPVYVVQSIPLADVEEVWTDVDDERAEEYRQDDPETMPPVVLGAWTQWGFEILDGGHRITARRRRACRTVLALVPLSEWKRFRKLTGTPDPAPERASG